jgi:hypothetical protein
MNRRSPNDPPRSYVLKWMLFGLLWLILFTAVAYWVTRGPAPNTCSPDTQECPVVSGS